MRKKSINLLQERNAPATLWERFYDWATNTCRIIVIITEALVLGAFGWRFWLDRKLNDLKDDIGVRGEILKSLSDQEDEIRLLQDKMFTYTELWSVSSNLSPTIKEVNRYIPTDIEELSFSMSTNETGRVLSISGEVGRSEISDLENKLKDSDSFSDVALSAIERKSDSSDIYNFTITAKIIFDEVRGPLTEDESTESST